MKYVFKRNSKSEIILPQDVSNSDIGWCGIGGGHGDDGGSGHQGQFPIGSYLKVNGSTKNVVRFLVLVRGNFFYIIWKLIYIALFWAVTVNFLVPPSWPKMALNPKKESKLTENHFLTMKGAPKNLKLLFK